METLFWNIVEFSATLAENVIAIWFLNSYFGFKEISQWKIRLGEIVTIAVLVFSTDYLIKIFSLKVSGNLIPVTLFFVYSLLFLKGNILPKLANSSFIMLVNSAIAILMSFSMILIQDKEYAAVVSQSGAFRFVGLLITKVLLFYVLLMVIRFKRRHEWDLKPADWIIGIVVPLISILCIATLLYWCYLGDREDREFFLILTIIGILITNSTVYVLFHKISKNNRYEREYALLKQQQDSTSQHMRDVELLYRDISQIRHDMRNYNVTLLSLLKEKDYGAIEEQLDFMRERINRRNYVSTQNHTLNNILNIKIGRLCDLEVKVRTQVATAETGRIRGEDLCVVIGNLMDNVVDYYGSHPHLSRKECRIYVGRTEEYFKFTIQNYVEESVLQKNPKLKTSKKDSKEHGIGIASVRDIVSRYDGMIDFYEEGKMFCCSCMMTLFS